VKTVFRSEASTTADAEEDDRELGLSVFEREIEMAGGTGGGWDFAPTQTSPYLAQEFAD